MAITTGHYKTHYGFAVTMGGNGLFDQVRDTFHTDELLPTDGVGPSAVYPVIIPNKQRATAGDYNSFPVTGTVAKTEVDTFGIGNNSLLVALVD